MKKGIFFLVIFLLVLSAFVFAEFANETETVLIVEQPDGNDGWYTYIPLIYLSNPNPDFSIIYYWNSMVLPDQVYAGPIQGTEDPAIGGISTLHYHAEDSYGNTEPDRVFISKVDFTPPSILDINPEPDSVIYKDQVSVYAYLEEFYQGNSGVKNSTIVLMLDGVGIPYSAPLKDRSDSILTSTVENLSVGMHTLYLWVEDNAGNNFEKEWSFKFTNNPIYSLNIDSPIDGNSYGARRVLVNISLDDIVSSLGYSDNGKRFVELCKNCDHAESNISFSEGYHSLTISAMAGGDEYYKTINFLVDTKLPKIVKVLPEKYTTGNFSVTYSENNVKDVVFFWKLPQYEDYQEVLLSDCASGDSSTCSALLDFNSSDKHSHVEYYFVVSDNIGLVRSDNLSVIVDSVAPEITIEGPVNMVYDAKKIPISLKTSEEVKLLSYSADGKPFRSLCMYCDHYNRSKPFSDGNHNITFKAVDYSGNIGTSYVGFEVDSNPPRNIKTFPDKVTNGTFWVVYTESSLESTTLFFEGHAYSIDCPSGNNVVCSASLNLSYYDSMLIDYYFKLSDKVSTAVSPLRTVFVNISEDVRFRGREGYGITIIL